LEVLSSLSLEVLSSLSLEVLSSHLLRVFLQSIGFEDLILVDTDVVRHFLVVAPWKFRSGFQRGRPFSAVTFKVASLGDGSLSLL
jgi:hypothetical protein